MPVQEHPEEMTDRDVLLEILGMALSDPETSALDVIERVEHLRPELVEEARAIQGVLDEVGDDLDPTEPTEPTEDE